MPVTPFHLGPGLFFGLIFIKYLDIAAFLIGNIILDIEPLIVVLSNIKHPYHSYPHHGFFHTILGAFLVSLGTAIILNKFQKKIQKITTKCLASEVKQVKQMLARDSSFSKIYFSVFLGTLVHLFFDSLIHYDVFPFWPSHFNPLLGLISVRQDYFACLILGILGIIIAIFCLRKKEKFDGKLSRQ